MNKIPFDISFKERIERGEVKVVTRDNREVTIIKWDLKGNYPIVACFKIEVCNYEGDKSWLEERPFAFSKEGKRSNGFPEDKSDLFILAQEPVSEDLEREIKRYLHEVYDRDSTVGDVARHFANWQKQQDEQFKDQFKAAIAWLEKQSEQNHVNEHKFNIGDWITRGEHYTYKIIAVGQGLYVVNKNNEEEVSLTFKYIEKHFHLWTIQDAKAGDVLTNKYGDVMLFKRITDDRHICGYCQYSAEDRKLYSECSDFPNYYPSTKEQRDLLFQKMKEAGYEWNAEKKELKKIEL